MVWGSGSPYLNLLRSRPYAAETGLRHDLMCCTRTLIPWLWPLQCERVISPLRRFSFSSSNTRVVYAFPGTSTQLGRSGDCHRKCTLWVCVCVCACACVSATGIPTSGAVLSWALTGQPGLRGEQQTQYQVQVQLLNGSVAWDSGSVASSQPSAVVQVRMVVKLMIVCVCARCVCALCVCAVCVCAVW